MRILITLLSVVCFGMMAQAATEIDTKASSFKWTGKKVTGQHYGTLPIKSSKLMEKKGQLVGGEIELDLTKMTVDDLTGDYQKKFLSHIKSADFFEVKKWPTAKLVIETVKGTKAKGKLTIKGITQPVEFAFKKAKDVYSGTLKFDRTKFKMIYGSGDFFKNLGDKVIYNDVTLDFKVKVQKKSKKVAQK